MTTQTLQQAPDLKNGFPRSPNASLGGFVLLPRIIDKCRATIAGTNGEYSFNCPLDRQFFDWTGVDAEGFRKEAEAGKSDDELLSWVKAHSKKTDEAEILAWSYQQRWRRPEGAQMQAFFEKLRAEAVPQNYQIETWFQLLDAEEKRC